MDGRWSNGTVGTEFRETTRRQRSFYCKDFGPKELYYSNIVDFV